MSAPPTKHRRGLAALVLGGGLGLALAMWLDSPPEEPAPIPTPPPAVVEPVATAGGLTMKIETTPPGANIWLSDQPAGTSPLELSMHPLPGTYPVRAELEGHAPGSAACVVTPEDLSAGTSLCTLSLAAL